MKQIHKNVKIYSVAFLVLLLCFAWFNTTQAQSRTEMEQLRSVFNSEQLQQYAELMATAPQVLNAFNLDELQIVTAYLAGQRVDRNAYTISIIDRLENIMPVQKAQRAHNENAKSGIVLDEKFTETTFPPVEWTLFKFEGAGASNWIRDTAQSNSAPASARRVFGGSADGNQISWLVTPPISIDSDSYVLEFFDRTQWPADYVFSGVLVSTGSGDPADGDFVEIFEINPLPALVWRTNGLDLSAFDGETIYIAFKYTGTFAHTWWIDDVLVYEPAAEPNPVTLIAPANEAINVSATPTLSWSAGSGSVPTAYDVYFGTDENPAFAGTVTETFWATPVLDFETTYYWYVVASNEAGSSDPSSIWSFTTFADPTISEFPYFQNFDEVTQPALPVGWTRISSQSGAAERPWRTSSGLTAPSVPNVAAVFFHPSNPKNEWMFSPAMILEGGVTYRMRFLFRAPGWEGVAENMAIYLGTEPTIEAMEMLVYDNDDELFPNYTQVTTFFTVDESGAYHLGWHAYSVADLDFVAFDDLEISVSTGQGSLFVDTDSIDFGTIFASGFSSSEFAISNIGDAAITVQLSVDNPAFTLSEEIVELDPDASFFVFVSFEPENAGEFSATVTLTAEDALGSPATVTLFGEAINPPVAGVTPGSFNVSAITGAPEVTRTLTISNTGEADLDFALAIAYDLGLPVIKRNIEVHSFTTEKHGVTRIETTQAIKAPFVSGAKAFDENGVISFEAGEGFAPGFIGGQQGWSTYSTNTTKPIVSAANASDGAWSLELSRHDGLGNGTFVGGFSPLFLIDEDVMSISYDLFIEATGGSDYDVIVQAPSQGFLTARVKFFWQGGIRLLDFNSGGTLVFVSTGVPFPVDEWFELTIEVDRTADAINYYLNGELFWVGAIFGGTVLEQVVVLHDNWNNGERGFVDNIRAGSDPGWLTADITSGTVAPGESVDVTLFFNTQDFEAGEYSADLYVFTNDPSNEWIEIPISYTLSDPVEVASIAELFAVAEPGDGVVYRITGEVYLTFNSTFRNRKVIVDETRGMVLDDNARNLSQNFNRYDGITGLTGTVALFNGLVQFIPSFDVPASSSDNFIVPQRANIADISNADQGSLVVIENVTFSQTGEFANQQNYTIIDQDGNELRVRTDRVVESILDEGETSYIGTEIPTGPVTVVGYITVFTNPQLVIRKLEDFIDPAAIASFNLVSPPNNAEVPIFADSDEPISITWQEAAGDDVEYLWMATAPGLSMSVPLLVLPGDNDGASPSLTLPQSVVAEVMAGFGVTEVGESLIIEWTVVAFNDEAFQLASQNWIVTLFLAAPPAGENVTFSINMSYQEDLGVFQPEVGDQVFVRGSFNGWSTVDGQELVETTPGIFEVTLFVEGEEGAEHAYKYYIMAGDGRELPNTGWEVNNVGPVGDNGDRLLVLVGEDQVLDTVWFNNEEGTSAGSEMDLPMEFALKQNYPNPFNPTTQIQYALPQASEVRIDVFNVMGQRVATLVNGAQNAGFHTVTFDANRLASGVYIYRMQAGSFVQTQKMLLVK